MKKNLMVTGKIDKVESEVRDLDEIIGIKKVGKFAKCGTREEYKVMLFSMNHIDLCEEIMRLGESPSCEARICREKCLALYDRAQNPRKTSYPNVIKEDLEDVIARGTKKPVKVPEPEKPVKTKKVKKD